MTLIGKRKFIAALASMALVVVAVSGLAAFGVRYIETTWALLGQTQVTVRQLEEQRQAVSMANRTFEELKSEYDLVGSSFATSTNPLPFIESIEALGRSSGVRVELSLASSQGGAKGSEYALVATGQFRSIMTFLERLEFLPFLIQLRDPTISATEGLAGPTKPAKAEPTMRLGLTVRLVTSRDKL